MIDLVSVSPQGHLRRYRCRHGDKPFLTHEADIALDIDEPAWRIVESFRMHPPFCFHRDYRDSSQHVDPPEAA
jgi:hypothetical protein